MGIHLSLHMGEVDAKHRVRALRGEEVSKGPREGGNLASRPRVDDKE